MPTEDCHDISKLTDAILEFSRYNPDSVCRLTRGQRIINQGDFADDCFLIEQGVVTIGVVSGEMQTESQIALRYQGDIVGETAIVDQNANRTANVQVVSNEATFVRISRNDIFAMLRDKPEMQDTINLLWALNASRNDETEQIINGDITIENQLMTALFADVHNTGKLEEMVWAEQLNAFLFEFIEQSEEMAGKYYGTFEDRGDGLKMLFRGPNHASESATFALDCAHIFNSLRSTWSEVNNAFRSLGLGIGICTDFMTIRKRQGASSTEGRILSQGVKVASSLSKCKSTPGDIAIYMNENTSAMVYNQTFSISEPQQLRLKKTGRTITVYRLNTETEPTDKW